MPNGLHVHHGTYYHDSAMIHFHWNSEFILKLDVGLALGP